MTFHSRKTISNFLARFFVVTVLYLLVFSLSSGYGNSASAQTCTPAPSGIIAWWTFDETNGTTAQDIIGGRNGMHINSPVPAPGKVGGALRFNGSSSYVDAPDSDLWAFGSNDFTIELWANWDAPGSGSLVHAGDVLIGNDEGPGDQNKWFFALGEGLLHFTVYNELSPPSNFYLVRAPFSPTAGQWYHLAVTKQGTLFTIYVDGTPIGSEVSTAPIANPDAPLIIGQANEPFGGFMNGLLDEITIYNRALTQGELQAIVAAGSAGKCKPSSSCVSPPANMVGWWPGDGNANDIQGTNHGTLQNGATFAPGLVGQAFSFNGAGDFVSLPASSVYPSGNSPRTVDMWVYTRDLSSWASEHTIFEYGAEPGTRTAFGIDMDGYQMIQFYAWGDDLDHISTGPKPVTGWMHIAVTYDGLTLRVYTDGVLRGTRTYPTGLNTTPSDEMVIGRSNNLFSCCPDSFSNTSFIGLIDEVEVFNRALSEAEIQSIYNAGSAGKCKSAIVDADLSVTKIAAPDPVPTSTNISYTITVANNGPDAATDVVVTDNLPAATTFVSCVATGGVCGGAGNNRTVTFASLASGASATITLVASVNCSLANGMAISNMASVSSSTPDSNPNNNSATANVVASNPPPAINGVSANPSALWPPNHKMVNVTVNYSVTDNCGSPSCSLSVSSNEPINGTGDGDTSPDWEIVDAHHVRLRAERAGTGTGRIYTITITCTDSAGNSSSKSVTVQVPKSQG